MSSISIIITASGVFTEVGRLTHFAGIKQEKKEGDFERISATESDKDMLLQFWNSACETLTGKFKNNIEAVTLNDTQYSITVKPSAAYDTNLTNSMKENMQKYIILHMASRWFMLTNKDDAEGYGRDAEDQLDEAMRKWYYKVKPKRTSPNA